MRRDQVHKVCANHFITEDMNLIKQSERAYMWVANDFADQEVVLENLCIRFKTTKEAENFRIAFENAKKQLDNKLSTGKLENKVDSIKVDSKPEKTPVAKVSEENKSLGNETPVKAGEKPVASLGGFVFTSTPSFKPKEDVFAISKTPSQPEPAKSSPFASFTFKPTTMPVNFNSLTPKAELKPVEKPKENDGDDSHTDDFVPTAEFKPVIPLPELVDVKTGEENSEVLFEHKAKLLRYDANTKEWKERGIGIMKLLKEENTARFVMRREQVCF